MKVNKANKPF